jgi:hypothetical protein
MNLTADQLISQVIGDIGIWVFRDTIEGEAVSFTVCSEDK